MYIQSLQLDDLSAIEELQPPDWGNILPDFQWYIEANYCEPLKIIIDDKIVAVGTTIAHQDTVWLAKIITHTGYRNKGLGKCITQALIDSVDKTRYKTIYLEATDLGYPVYKRLGFEIDTLYVHCKGIYLNHHLAVSTYIVPFEESYRDTILQIDRQVSGEDRTIILNKEIQNAQLFIKRGIMQGFYMPTLYNGMIIANNTLAGIELMKSRLLTNQIATLPIDNLAALQFLLQNQILPFKASRRMILGKKRTWQPSLLFNRMSGQLG